MKEIERLWSLKELSMVKKGEERRGEEKRKGEEVKSEVRRRW